MPHAHAAVAGVGAAARLPVVVPENGAVARVDGPDVVGRGHVDDAIHHQDAAAQARGAAGVQIALAESADDDGSRGFAAAASTEAAASAVAAEPVGPQPVVKRLTQERLKRFTVDALTAFREL